MPEETQPDPGIPMQPVQSSSNVTARGYDHDKQLLYVEFKGGSTYCYRNVDRDVWNAWLSAESAGKFFLAEIKPKCLDFTKLPPKAAKKPDEAPQVSPQLTSNPRTGWPFPAAS